MYLILVTIHTNPQISRHTKTTSDNVPDLHTLCWRHPITQTDNELGDLLDVDDIFVLLASALLALGSDIGVYGTRRLSVPGIGRYDLRTVCNLKGMFFCHMLSVHSKIP